MENKKEIYNKIFKLFCDTSGYRINLDKPFKQEGFYMSTDANKLIMLNANLIDLGYISIDKPKATRFIHHTEKTPEFYFNISELKSKLIFEMIYPIEYIECDKCDGDGYLECDLGHEHDCEKCNGNGEIEIENMNHKVINTSQLYNINNFTFKTGDLKPLIDTCELLEIDKVEIIQFGSGYNPHIFKINDFYIVIMPMSNNNEGEKIDLNLIKI